MGCMYETDNIILMHKSALTADGADQVRAALSRLQTAAELIDAAGRGLAPYVAPASSEGLVELSTELCNIREMISRRLVD